VPLQIESAAPSVVRRYIEALARGDDGTAYAALGGAAGDPGLTLVETFMDASARITRLKTTTLSPTEAQVDAEITTAKGVYDATYRVKFSPKGGAYIASHDYIKV